MKIEEVLKQCIYHFLLLMHIKLSEAQYNRMVRFIKFSLVGVSNTLISYSIYIIFIKIGMHYMYGNIVGFIVSVLNAVYWNNKYVFKRKTEENRYILITIIKSFISYGATSFFIGSILLFIWIDILHISEIIAPILNLLITIPLNFIANKVWIFKIKERKRGSKNIIEKINNKEK